MSVPEFCTAGYRTILAAARAADYHFSTFRDFTHPVVDGPPVLLLRHDLDHSIRAGARLADIEAEFNVHATYFVQVRCDFYNLLSRESRGLILAIARSGHEIGLHYEAERYLGPKGRTHLATDLALIEDIAGTKVVSASQHIPIAGEVVDLGPDVTNEAYESRFTQNPMTYISDSLLRWRGIRPLDLIAKRSSFQLLTHPAKWAEDEPVALESFLEIARQREVVALNANYADILDYYRGLLRDRDKLDANFRERRGIL